MRTSASAESYRIAGNVFLDPNSSHDWQTLVQRDFLADTFEAMNKSLPPEQRDVRFYVFSPFTADQMPASIAFNDERKVLIFLSDEAESVTPTALSPHYIAIFKPYMRADRAGTNIFPMSLGVVNGVSAVLPKPMPDRRVGLLFTGNLNRNRYPLYFAFHPFLRRLPGVARSRVFHLLARSPVGRLLRRDFSRAGPAATVITFTSGFGEGFSKGDYAAMLADSRIVLAPRGFVSSETFRHLEALRAGAVVISERLPDTFLYRGGPFVCVDNWNEGLRVADELLRDPERLQALQDAGLRWYEDVLSPAATARRIVDQVRDVDA